MLNQDPLSKPQVLVFGRFLHPNGEGYVVISVNSCACVFACLIANSIMGKRIDGFS